MQKVLARAGNRTRDLSPQDHRIKLKYQLLSSYLNDTTQWVET